MIVWNLQRSLFGWLLGTVRPGMGISVMVVCVYRRRVVQDLQSDNFGFGKPVNDHGGGQNQWQQTKRQGFPCFQRDYGDRDRDQYGGLELQTQQEWNDDFTDETAAWKKTDMVEKF